MLSGTHCHIIERFSCLFYFILLTLSSHKDTKYKVPRHFVFLSLLVQQHDDMRDSSDLYELWLDIFASMPCAKRLILLTVSLQRSHSSYCHLTNEKRLFVLVRCVVPVDTTSIHCDNDNILKSCAEWLTRTLPSTSATYHHSLFYDINAMLLLNLWPSFIISPHKQAFTECPSIYNGELVVTIFIAVVHFNLCLFVTFTW